MAFDVYPVGANSGFSEESSIDSEKDRDVFALGGRLADHVADPVGGDFDLTTSGSSLDVDVAAGTAFMSGHRVVSDATVTLTVDASSTNYIWLVVRDAETGNAIIEYNTTGSAPSGAYAMKLAEVDTDSSGVTATRDFRPPTAFAADQVATSADSIAGQTSDQPVDATGVQTFTVTLPAPFPTALDHVELTLAKLTDSAVSSDHVRVPPSNLARDSFQVEYDISNAGSSGTVANWFYTARGH